MRVKKFVAAIINIFLSFFESERVIAAMSILIMYTSCDCDSYRTHQVKLHYMFGRYSRPSAKRNGPICMPVSLFLRSLVSHFSQNWLITFNILIFCMKSGKNICSKVTNSNLSIFGRPPIGCHYFWFVVAVFFVFFVFSIGSQELRVQWPYKWAWILIRVCWFQLWHIDTYLMHN